MPRIITALLTVLLLQTGAHAQASDPWYDIKADDGATIANHRVPVELESQIESLPGVVTVGNPRGDVTIVEFYDLNCPYCRKAAADLAALLKADRELKVVLVPFPVLGIPSIAASRVELAVAKLARARFYDFHQKVYAGRGVIDANRALAAAKEIGLRPEQVIGAANDDSVTETMKAHVRLGDSMGLAATPSFVIKGVAIVGHPGRAALAAIIRSIRTCDKVVCG
jgi:protein-disulfide isomerase